MMTLHQFNEIILNDIKYHHWNYPLYCFSHLTEIIKFWLSDFNKYNYLDLDSLN